MICRCSRSLKKELKEALVDLEDSLAEARSIVKFKVNMKTRTVTTDLDGKLHVKKCAEYQQTCLLAQQNLKSCMTTAKRSIGS